MTIKAVLRGAHLFQQVTDRQLDLIIGLCRRVSVPTGRRIFEEGEPARAVYIVEKGRVALEMRLERPDGSMTDVTTVAAAGPGDAFGWSALVPPHVLTLSARTIEPSALLTIEGEGLRAILSQHSDVGYALMSNVAGLLASRLAQTREALVYERGWWLELAQRTKKP
jgi:CRP-like cAMP-binding protein